MYHVAFNTKHVKLVHNAERHEFYFVPLFFSHCKFEMATFVLQAMGGNVFVDRGSSFDVMSKIYFSGNTLRYLSDQAWVRIAAQIISPLT